MLCPAMRFAQSVVAAVMAAGHRVCRRPPYSPNHAPIEQAFHTVKSYLRRHSREVNEGNLALMVKRACREITAHQIRRYFSHAGYF